MCTDILLYPQCALMYATLSVDILTVFSNSKCMCVLPASVAKLKELIKEQTDLDPSYQELFYENLPYRSAHPEPAAKLPLTTVWTTILCVYYTMLKSTVYKLKFPQQATQLKSNLVCS